MQQFPENFKDTCLKTIQKSYDDQLTICRQEIYDSILKQCAARSEIATYKFADYVNSADLKSHSRLVLCGELLKEFNVLRIKFNHSHEKQNYSDFDKLCEYVSEWESIGMMVTEITVNLMKL